VFRLAEDFDPLLLQIQLNSQSLHNPYAVVTILRTPVDHASRLDTPAGKGYKALYTKATTGTSTVAQPRQSEPGAV
jgi:hypothetical protein